jgi:hypothetical protein
MNNRYLINNKVSILFGIIILVLLIKFTEENFDFNFLSYIVNDLKKLGSLLVFFVGIMIHENLHRLGWGIKVTKIKNHTKWKIPYCQCETPLGKRKFIFGLTLPLIILGLVPYILGVVLNSEFFFFFSLIMTVPCVSDLLILFKLINKKGKFKLLEDQKGFEILK